MNSITGFMFTYGNAKLSKSKPISEDECNLILKNKRNTDDIPLYVKCKHCHQFMNFVIGPNNCLDGKWICSNCNIKVREKTIYSQLERENEKYILKFIDEDKPYMCENCGGPWPACISSCRFYND